MNKIYISRKIPPEVWQIIYCLFILVVPNLFFVLIASYFGVHRPIINVDYLLVVTLLAFGLYLPSIVMLIAFLLADFFALFGQVFTFIRISDLIALMRYLPYTSNEYKLMLLFLLVAIVVKGFFITWIGLKVNKRNSLIIFNVFIFLLAYQTFTYNDDSRYYRVDSNLKFVSQTEFLISQRMDSFTAGVFESAKPLEDYSGKRAVSAVGWDECCNNVADKLLLIINESWGVGNNKDADQYLINQIKLDSANLSYDKFLFTGATVAAELRELCALTPGNFNLMGHLPELDKCLPHQLNKNGYMTQAVHGAVSHMYDRRNWYPQAGFVNMTFQEELGGKRRCYSYPGACDIDTIKVVENFFEEHEKGFQYWLTLNTHARYDERDIINDHFDCHRFDIKDDEVCRYYKLQAQFFNTLGESIKAGRLDGVDILVVGDHEPRLTDQKKLKNYFFSNAVPWIRINLTE